MRVAEGAGQKLCWNAGEFRVGYPSLASQLCIGGVYVRLLLDGVDQVNKVILMSHGNCHMEVSHTGMVKSRVGSEWCMQFLVNGNAARSADCSWQPLHLAAIILPCPALSLHIANQHS